MKQRKITGYVRQNVPVRWESHSPRGNLLGEDWDWFEPGAGSDSGDLVAVDSENSDIPEAIGLPSTNEMYRNEGIERSHSLESDGFLFLDSQQDPLDMHIGPTSLDRLGVGNAESAAECSGKSSVRRSCGAVALEGDSRVELSSHTVTTPIAQRGHSHAFDPFDALHDVGAPMEEDELFIDLCSPLHARTSQKTPTNPSRTVNLPIAEAESPVILRPSDVETIDLTYSTTPVKRRAIRVECTPTRARIVVPDTSPLDATPVLRSANPYSLQKTTASNTGAIEIPSDDDFAPLVSTPTSKRARGSSPDNASPQQCSQLDLLDLRKLKESGQLGSLEGFFRQFGETPTKQASRGAPRTSLTSSSSAPPKKTNQAAKKRKPFKASFFRRK